MMPGESQSKIVRIAADATVGTCQNCSVLNQNLNEYVASFLALKQKITDSDHLLSKYQEKHNELQRSQSETVRLQGQLEELQVKHNADYELVRAELEEKKCTLKAYGQVLEEMDKLKEENSRSTSQNKKLKDQIKNVEELTEKQTLENSQLKREKASLENDLRETQESLKTSQALADQFEKLKEENAKTISIKTSLENQLRLLEESVHKQSHQISLLMKEKNVLERNIGDLQLRLLKLERERSKEYRSSSTQASAPKEPKVDKEKVRMLLKNLWECVEPQQLQSANTLHLPEASSKQVFPSSQENRLHSQLAKCDGSHSASQKFHETHTIHSKATCSPSPPTPCMQKATNGQAPVQCTSGKKQRDSAHKSKRWSKEHMMQDSSAALDSQEVAIEEILLLFKPLLPCISPVPDSDREVDSQESDNGEMENHLKPTSESDSILITTPDISHHPEYSQLPADQTVELPVVTTQKMDDIFSENNSKQFGQHKSPGTTEIKSKRDSVDTAEINKQEDMETEQLPETVKLPLSSSLSSSPSDTTVLVEVAPLTTESEESQYTLKPSNSLSVDTCMSKPALCHTQETGGLSMEHTQGEVGEDESAGITTIDVVASTYDVTAVEVMSTNDGKSLREKNNNVVSEAVSDTQSVTSTTFTGFIQHRDVTNAENEAEMGKTSQDSNGLGLDKQNTMEVVLRAQEANVKEFLGEEAEVLEEQPCLSEVAVSNSVSGTSDKKLKDRDGNGAYMKHLGEANGDKALETEADGKPASPVESNNSKIYEEHSPQKSPVFRMVDKVETFTDKETYKNDEAPSTKGICTKTLDSSIIAEHHGVSLSESQETTQTVGYESVKESIHPPSSSSLSPTVKQQPLKPLVEPGKGTIDVSPTESEHLTTSIKTLEPVLKSVEGGAVEKSVLIDPPKATVDPSDKKVSTDTRLDLLTFSFPIDGQTTPLKQRAASTNGPNESGNSREGELSPEMTRETVSLSSPTSVSPVETVAQQPEVIGQVRSEMGPPLPPLLAPLSATPPKIHKPINPRQAIGKLTFPSPMDRLASPSTPVQSHMASNSQQQNSPSLSSPLPPNGVPSSPLQFGSATPKHAVPVPGRLPLSALNSCSSSSSSPSQENSMRILDTMYPELSARARTLSILRGNVGLSICSSETGTTPTTTVGQISGFKTINSSSTAFTKTELRGEKTELRGEKRPAINLPQPKNNKWLRLDTSSSSLIHKALPSTTTMSADETTSAQSLSPKGLKKEITSQSVEPGEKTLIATSLEKIENQCFDLLPVIKSHLDVGNLPKKPVLRDEEKEVISEICQSGTVIADDMIVAILNKLKTERGALSGNHMQALCRVHTGICRQMKDWEKAHILAYSILKEDFPDPAKLILFMVTTWPNVLSHGGSLCQAILAVTRLKAQEEVLNCLSACLAWEKSPPCDIEQLIASTLSEIQAGSSLSFKKHSRYGDDLGADAWELVFTLDLICSHKKWKWSYENVLGKELWPLMNTWVTQPRDQQTPISDAIVATVLRLIGRLGHQGIKEKCVSSVLTVANVINTFGRHGHAEGVPWEVQLAAIYCIYDLSPCNPKQALDAIAGWRGETTQSVPPAVTSCINQIACFCRQIKS